MNEEIKYAKIEDYLNDSLSEESRNSFEEEMNNNAVLRREVELHRELAHSLKGEKFEKLRTTLKEVNADWSLDSSRKSSGRIFKLSPRIQSIAAAISLLIVASLWFVMPSKQSNPTALFTQNFEPYEVVLSQRSMDAPNYNGLEAAISAYAEKDYYKSQALFSGLYKLNPQQPIFNLYACVSQLAIDNAQSTIACFQDLQGINRLKEQATWYLSLAYLKNSDIKMARATLLSIEDGQFMFSEAQSLLNKLD